MNICTRLNLRRLRNKIPKIQKSKNISGDDMDANVIRLCHKALNPVRRDIVEKLDLGFKLECGAVCVYPARVKDAYTALQNAKSELPVASGTIERLFKFIQLDHKYVHKFNEQ